MEVTIFPAKKEALLSRKAGHVFLGGPVVRAVSKSFLLIRAVPINFVKALSRFPILDLNVSFKGIYREI